MVYTIVIFLENNGRCEVSFLSKGLKLVNFCCLLSSLSATTN